MLAAALDNLKILAPDVAETLTDLKEDWRRQLFPDDEKYYDFVDEDGNLNLKPYVPTDSSSEDEEEVSTSNCCSPIGDTTYTNLCTLPLMCICLLGDMENPSRLQPVSLTQSQKTSETKSRPDNKRGNQMGGERRETRSRTTQRETSRSARVQEHL